MKPKITLILAPLCIFLFLEGIFLNINFFYPGIILINFLTFYAVKKIGEFSLKNKFFWNHLILPIFFINSLLGYFVLNGNLWLLQFLIFIGAFFVYYYLRQLYFDKILNQEIKWENLSYYFGFLTLFFIFSFIFSSQGSLFSAGYLTIALIIVLILITYQVFCAQKVVNKKAYIYILVITLILTEITWVFFFLPFSYNVGGLILAIIYYLCLGLTRLFLKDALTKKRLKFYLSLSLSCIFIILITARIF